MKPSPRASRLGSLLVLGLSVASFRDARAQCGPDGLDLGNCCQAANALLPPFPALQMPGLGIVWNNCIPVQQANLVVDCSAFVMVGCGEYQSTLTVRDVSTTFTLLAGTLTLDYTRTWLESPVPGTVSQVWRFTAKVDLKVATAGIPLLAPIPNCIAPFGPHPSAFFYGYLDVADDCTGIVPRSALVLYHANDFFIHNPLLSDKPGAFHASRGFAIVAPHSTTQVFVPVNQLAPQGPMFGEATRPVKPTSPVCIVEDPVVGGQIPNFGGACLCSFSTTPTQHSFRQVVGLNACPDPTGVGGNFRSLAIGFPSPLPWFHMTSTSIGFWTNPTQYPGVESAWVDEGLFLRHQACSGDFVSIDYGATTNGGFPVMLPIPVLVSGFTDLADNYTAPTSGPFPFPILGSVRPTDHLIYVNVP